MFLDIYSNNGIRYIRISESYRIEKNGVRVARKKTVKTIGPVSRFDDGLPDFERRLKESFKACTPLIDELKPYVKKEVPKEIYNFSIHAGTTECIGHPKFFATCILDKILDDIGVRSFVGSYKNYDKLEYDVLGFMKLAIYGRLINPQSKIATVKQNNCYYSPILSNDFNKYNIYDMLDFVYKHKNALFSRIDMNMRKKFNRTTNNIFYDVTNFFFETENADKHHDETGECFVNGLRQFGVSKEERRLPIVQMGLLMDEQGYPISIEAFNGNTLDHQTLVKSFNNAPETTKKSRYIFVSDKGIGKGENMKYAIKNGNGYVVSKSVRGSSKDDISWMLQDDYTMINPGFKKKSRIYTKTYILDDGTELKSSEKQVTYWSKKFYDKEYYSKKDYYDFLQKLIEQPETFKISKIEAGMFSRHIKKNLINKKTGEIINSKDLKAMLDMEKIENEFKLLGYYSIITSETQMSDDEIIETYHNLVNIEEEFKIMKMTLETRPIFLRKPEHITAHLVLCTISLLILRIIQNQLKKSISSTNSSTISAERIKEALNCWTVEKLADEYYRFNNIDNSDLKLIFDAFGIEIPLKLYRLGELKHIKQTINYSR